MKISPWLRPPGTSTTEWLIASGLWGVLVIVVWAGISLAAWGLLAFAFRLFS